MKRILLFASLLFILTHAFAQKRSTKGNVFPQFQQVQKNVARGQVQNIFRQYFSMTQADKLELIKSEKDQLGFVHEKFQQYYKNIKVEGATYTAHSKDGFIRTISGNFQGIKDLDVSPAISKATAFSRATGHVNARIYAWDSRVKRGFPGYEKPTGELVIVADEESKIEPTLAYKFDIYSAEPLYRAWVFIDAKTGQYIKENQRIHDANVSATANTRYNGTRSITADYTGSNYRLRTTAVTGVNGAVETYSLNNGTNYSAATDITSANNTFTGDITANQAHWGAERTFDYYRVIHNRNSYNNAGAVIKSYVHYSNNYVNAFWDGSRMTYGDGNGTTYGPLVSLDICGHEITHGVTEYSANLIYSNQSGALNESFSDIFGEAIEHHAKGSNDWLMSQDIGTAFRSMSNPNAKSDPDTYMGLYWYSGTGDNGGVHTNSGVQNKWFYILTQGESGTNDIGNAYNVAGIGITDAARIAYRNLTVYLSSSSNYEAARTGAIQAAIDLFGAGSTQVIATTNAWYAVGVGCTYNVSCYCTSAGSNATYEYIKTVTIGSFTKTSGSAGYSNFTASTISLTPSSSNNVTLVPGFASTTYNEYWKIWIDFNKDGDFADAGEQVFAAGLSNTTVTGTLAIPASATGTTRMRVSMKYNAQQTACETFAYGEVEDYTVSFTPAVPDVTPPSAPVLSSTGTTQSTINLNWSAATDNVAVTGYDVYVNDLLNGSTAGTTYTVTGLAASTTYSIFVKAKDAAGNNTASNTISATTQAASAITIFGHSFETGWDGWKDGGGDCERYSGARSYEGSYSIQLRDNATTSSAMTSAVFNLSSYNTLTLEFKFYSYGMEDGEDFWVRYYDGSTWSTVGTFIAGTHFSNNGFYHAEVTLNNVPFPLNAQFRIQCDASDNSDLVYVDAVVLKGSTAAALNNNNTQTIKLLSMLNTDGDNGVQGITGNSRARRMKLYPNPVVSNLTFDTDAKVKSLRIYSSNGTLVKNIIYLYDNKIDVSQLKPGLYVVKWQTDNGMIIEKFIKK